MTDEKSPEEEEKSTPEKVNPLVDETGTPLGEVSKDLQAGASARSLTFAVSPGRESPEPDDAPAAAPKPEPATRTGLTTAQREKLRPGAFSAVFDKAREKLTAARDTMKDTIPLKALVLGDARPTLADPGSERDRWVLKDGRALDGIVTLAVPVGKVEWHASFGRECLNYAAIARNTSKRQAIMPQYGDKVIAYVNTMVDGQAPTLFETDPTDIGDVDAWVQARVGEMLGTIDARRAALAKKAERPTST